MTIRLKIADLGGETGFAIFSPEKRPVYRYALGRIWGNHGRLINFLMLNPSKATHVDTDPTITRCKTRAQMLGYDGFIVTNLFALRSTDPKGLKKVRDPIGPLNDRNILFAAAECKLVLCGWGLHGAYQDRGSKVLATLRRRFPDKLRALHLTKDGIPGHPLFLPYDLQPFELK